MVQKFIYLILILSVAIYKATMEAPSTLQGGGQFPAVGYITEDESQV